MGWRNSEIDKSKAKEAQEILDFLEPELRREVIGVYCPHCGERCAQPCVCERDE